MESQRNEERQSIVPEGYEPPAVEEVLSPQDLAREVHYAGENGSFVIG
jgi:hypothetical protein